MRPSNTNQREFPAFFMTVLFIGASLASTGSLRTVSSEPVNLQPSAANYYSVSLQYEMLCQKYERTREAYPYGN